MSCSNQSRVKLEVKICSVCNGQFTDTGRSRRVFCSRKCANIGAYANVWTEEENSRLLKLINRTPVRIIAKNWNNFASKKGWIQRTENAVQDQITKLCRKHNLTSVCTKDEFKQTTLAKLLDIKVDRVRSWVRAGLAAKTLNGNVGLKWNSVAISKFDLEEFANKRPEMFYGINPSFLRRVINSKAVVDKIIERTNTQLPKKRDYAIIRLDKPAVYSNCEEAAKDVNMTRQGIRYNLEHGEATINGMEWARLEYTLFIVPSAIRNEFNYHAGWILIEIYQDLKRIDGFSKRSVLPTANRIAVQVTIMAFRRNHRETVKGIPFTPKKDICEFWKDKMIANIQRFYQRQDNACFNWILSTIKNKAEHIIRDKVELEEFALDAINELSRYFLNKSFLPNGYQPKTALEKADYYSAIFGYSMVTVDITSEKRMSLITLKALKRKGEQEMIKEAYSEQFLRHNF
ncbi:MAG: hypothetical protein RMY28_009480 [Nostoc sp. ChiSLP01]|nr:hypothetical protein [Nostoc sp. CmiSLP01]MDZ8285214.1 hypothetical protein [Nostoc sp. ChiSLP01]